MKSMKKSNINLVKKITALLLLALCIALAAVLLQAYKSGKFDSVETLQAYVAGFGILAPVILTTIQAIQVVIPVLPGWLGCLAGGAMFGTAGGFWCNYIGISLGSIIAFWLARVYGAGLVELVFPSEKYNRLAERVRNAKSYTFTLSMAILLPLAPDDFLCYFSGLIKMSARKFIAIVILAKPWCILAYSIISGGSLL